MGSHWKSSRLAKTSFSSPIHHTPYKAPFRITIHGRENLIRPHKCLPITAGPFTMSPSTPNALGHPAGHCQRMNARPSRPGEPFLCSLLRPAHLSKNGQAMFSNTIRGGQPNFLGTSPTDTGAVSKTPASLNKHHAIDQHSRIWIGITGSNGFRSCTSRIS